MIIASIIIREHLRTEFHQDRAIILPSTANKVLLQNKTE